MSLPFPFSLSPCGVLLKERSLTMYVGWELTLVKYLPPLTEALSFVSLWDKKLQMEESRKEDLSR